MIKIFMLLKPYLMPIVGGGVIIVGGYVAYLNMKVNTLEHEIDQLKIKRALLQANANVCKSALDKCNSHVEDLRIEYTKSVTELDEWRTQEPEVKYIYIDKIREVKSDDCQDVSNVLNIVRDIDANEL